MTDESARRSELTEMTMTVMTALNDVVTALRGEVIALGVREQQGRRRLALYLVMVGLVGVASVIGIGFNYSQGQDVKSIVHYIQDCQNPEGKCKQRSDDTLARAIIIVSGSVFDATACMQRLPLADRTDDKIKQCRDRYIGVIKK